MKIWVYDSLERCDNVDPPNAVGTLYADGMCRTIETDEPTGTDDYNKFPGHYKATCTAEGKIRFSDSGCLSDTCAVPGGDAGVCLRDFTIAGALFSRLSPPEYVVQQERNAGTGAFFTCFKLDGSADNPVTVTFVVFGDCSTCDPSAPSVPTTPTPAPIFPTAPFAFPSSFSWVTRKPSSAPVVQPVTVPPATAGPTVAPSATPTTNSPTFAPVIAGQPTRPPVTPAPVTASPTAAPVAATAPTTTPTQVRIPKTEPPNGEVGLTTFGSIAVALDLSPMTGTMSESATKVFVVAASNQIQETSPNVESVELVKLNQSFRDNNSLRVSFDLLLEYEGDTKAVEIFENAFGTEKARSNLLLQLVRNDPGFEMLRLIEVAGGAPSENVMSNTNNPALLAGGIGAAGTIVVMLLLGAVCFLRKRKSRRTARSHAAEPGEIGAKSQSVLTVAESQKYTNEIVVDTEADEISTLGGSINGGVTVGDEPTASVNLDYDFERKQYIVDGETNTAFTAFSALSKTIPTASVFADDDGSFEQQFVEVERGAVENRKILPFEVQVPPGLLGMVVDTPNGGVPVVRAIKPESILVGKVQIGDRLIAVDHQDVTRMTALDVSNMISLKQNKTRTLVFVRLDRLP